MSTATERHFTVPEVAELWKLSEDKVRQIFREQPGVVRIGNPEKMHKRGYITLRIPQSVVEKVHAALRGRAA
jgi:hypothetical protein